MSNSTPRWALKATLWSQWAYWCCVAVAFYAATTVPAGDIRTVLVLLPVLPGILIFGVTYFIYQACDEYVRQRTMQAVGRTAVAVALATMVYSYLELLGWPRLSMAWVHSFGWLVFIPQMVALMLRG